MKWKIAMIRHIQQAELSILVPFDSNFSRHCTERLWAWGREKKPRNPSVIPSWIPSCTCPSAHGGCGEPACWMALHILRPTPFCRKLRKEQRKRGTSERLWAARKIVAERIASYSFLHCPQVVPVATWLSHSIEGADKIDEPSPLHSETETDTQETGEIQRDATPQ